VKLHFWLSSARKGVSDGKIRNEKYRPTGAGTAWYETEEIAQFWQKYAYSLAALLEGLRRGSKFGAVVALLHLHRSNKLISM
jgi:hypothetical protein